MKDMLNMEMINRIGQMYIRQYGDRHIWWPLYEVCVQTGFMKVDVCGLLQNMHFDDIAEIKDDSGEKYDPEIFYL